MSNNSMAGRPALQDASNRVNQTPILPPPNPYLTKAAGQSPTPNTQPQPSTTATHPKTANNRKRKSDASLEDEIAAYKQAIDIDTNLNIDKTCSQVRSEIKKLLNRGIMSKSEFCAAIVCNVSSLDRFLSKRGSMSGQFSNAYITAWHWFKKRELAGLKMPNAKKRQKTTAPSAPAVDISNIHLPGEETNKVPVYDTCDEIRRKIKKHLATPGVTAAQFCRDIYAQLSHPTIKPFQSKQLNDFRSKQGPNAGGRSKVFYAAYVYFEKRRIAEGQPKSEHRLNMEKIWAKDGGFDLEHDDQSYVFVGRDEIFFVDEYGKLHFQRCVRNRGNIF